MFYLEHSKITGGRMKFIKIPGQQEEWNLNNEGGQKKKRRLDGEKLVLSVEKVSGIILR